MAERLRPAGRVRVALLLMPLVVGCTLFQATEKARYETVAADPNRDTQAAVKKHEKALKIIERASNPAYYQCSCVAKKLCNVHKAEQLLHDALVADVRYGPGRLHGNLRVENDFRHVVVVPSCSETSILHATLGGLFPL